MVDIQQVIVFIIIGIAVCIAGYKVYKTFFLKKSGCDGCASDCSGCAVMDLKKENSKLKGESAK